MRSAPLKIVVLSWLFAAAGCSAEGDGQIPGAAGSSQTGGSGLIHSGGDLNGSGGTQPSGGTSTGGPGSGGANTGGASMGGSSSGGASMGGSSSGGASMGGSSSGGTSSGGSSSGGTSMGGSSSGGASMGGASMGGSSSGGTSSGGSNASCTNVRPTGTDWDEATCDQWASDTQECASDWMIQGGFCDESCGRCGSTGAGGAGMGGAGTGGTGTGGASTGGASMGGSDTGGAAGAGAGGTGTGGDTGVVVDCDATMPTSGGTQHSNTWAQGGSGNLAWQIWTNGGPGNLITYDGITAFTASWNNSGDYLGRMGFEWGNSGKPYAEYGTIKADYVWNKSGTAGQYSYLGIYGWSVNPCVEWYIVEDSFHQMPFNTGDRPVGTAEVDGGTYNLVYRRTSGTGGDRCGGAASWDQFYSIRLEGSRCGTITVSDHFDVWAAQGWQLGNLLEVKIVVEAAAGQGQVDFPVANVTTSQ